MNNELPEDDDEQTLLARRKMDRIQADRLTAISGTLARLQELFDKRIEEIAEIQRIQAALIERIAGINERFAAHDRQENEDRVELLGVLKTVTETLAVYGQEIKAHGEAIGTLKQWDMLIAMAVAAVATSGVWWIIQHLQAMAAK
ncbi:MAG: hypothetical protein RKO66_12000 [Candidatus Contendobacter sp.]|nr:hypothetical protein [Candidatus Contendobacter sp.]MDS4059662.1 hypothetical protein [Candidatus Contendobacter sp.]